MKSLLIFVGDLENTDAAEIIICNMSIVPMILICDF